MSTDTTSENDSRIADETRGHAALARATAVVRDVLRVALDVVTVGLWVLLVTLLALDGGWSRPQFYSLLFLGVVCYVLVTREYDLTARK